MGWRPVGDYALPAALPHKLYLDGSPLPYTVSRGFSEQMGDDAKAYQEQKVRNALAQVKGLERHNGYER